MRFLEGRTAVLQHTFETDDDTPLTPSVVNVTVTRDGATVPVFDGPAVLAPSGVYTIQLNGLALGVYTVLWNGGTGATDRTSIEVVGGHLFTIAEVRASDVELTADRFPNSAVVRLRDRVADEFERITGRSFVTRVARLPPAVVDDGNPLPLMDVQSVHLEDGQGVPANVYTLERIGPFTLVEGVEPAGNYTAEVRYGFPAVPEDVKGAALLRFRSLLFAERSGIPDRATSFQPADGGTYALSTPGVRGAKTGIPDVDVVLADHTYEILQDIAL